MAVPPMATATPPRGSPGRPRTCLRVRCVRGYPDRSLEKDCRFPAKLSKSGPDESGRMVAAAQTRAAPRRTGTPMSSPPARGHRRRRKSALESPAASPCPVRATRRIAPAACGAFRSVLRESVGVFPRKRPTSVAGVSERGRGGTIPTVRSRSVGGCTRCYARFRNGVMHQPRLKNSPFAEATHSAIACV